MMYAFFKAMKWIKEIIPVIHYAVFQNVLRAKLRKNLLALPEYIMEPLYIHCKDQ